MQARRAGVIPFRCTEGESLPDAANVQAGLIGSSKIAKQLSGIAQPTPGCLNLFGVSAVLVVAVALWLPRRFLMLL